MGIWRNRQTLGDLKSPGAKLREGSSPSILTMKEVKFVQQGVLVKKNVIADAMETLAKAIKKDPGYRHAWKANISCKIYDSKHNKLSMKKTNEIAEDIIKMLFERK